MVKIEKDRPLPRHTKLDYDECYAKIILEMFFLAKYQDLQISDRPDLRTKDGNIGIEVTSAIPQEEQEGLALACEISYIDKENQEKRIAYLKKKGYEYTKYGMSHPSRSYGWIGFNYPDIEKTFCRDFIHAVEEKVKKLNSGNYDLLPEYDLFVQSELYIEEWMQQKLIDELCQLSTQQYNYKFIYLLALNGLFVFDVSTQKYSMKETGEKLWGLGTAARDMVEKGEINEKT